MVSACVPSRIGLALLVASLLSIGLPEAGAAAFTALDEYVLAQDDAYAWEVKQSNVERKYLHTHIDLKSQQWREHLWQHDLQLVRPKKVRNPDIAFLFVTGDGDGLRQLEIVKVLAERAGAVGAVVTRVPNQPLYDGRTEDALIAYTFDQYTRTGDKTWPLLFPMAKSAVRAMDAVAEFSRRENGQTIRRFVVGGASKRGWTTWLAAAVDTRVVGMSPMVIDMLNMQKQIEWAEKMYGKQSEQIHDYTDLRLHLRMDEPRMVDIRQWTDPFHYRDRYSIPKLILLGTNDPYWVVDSLRHYWHELPGPKLLYQTPNAGHGLGGGKEAIKTLAAFFQMVADGQTLPSVTWNFKPNGNREIDLKVYTTQKARKFRVWTADSTDRDFRPDVWSDKSMNRGKEKRDATAVIEAPDMGFRAIMGEVELKAPTGHAYKLSTEVRVTPENAP